MNLAQNVIALCLLALAGLEPHGGPFEAQAQRSSRNRGRRRGGYTDSTPSLASQNFGGSGDSYEDFLERHYGGGRRFSPGFEDDEDSSRLGFGFGGGGVYGGGSGDGGDPFESSYGDYGDDEDEGSGEILTTFPTFPTIPVTTTRSTTTSTTRKPTTTTTRTTTTTTATTTTTTTTPPPTPPPTTTTTTRRPTTRPTDHTGTLSSTRSTTKLVPFDEFSHFEGGQGSGDSDDEDFDIPSAPVPNIVPQPDDTRPDTSSESSERDSSSDNGSGTGFGGHSDDEDDIWSETESWPTEEEARPPSPTPTLAPPSTPGGENGDYKKKHVEVDEVEFDEIDVIRPDFGPDEDPDSSVLFANHLLVIVLYSGIVGCLASCILVALCVIGARKCRQKQYGMNEEGSESTASSDLPIIKGQHHNGQRGKGGQVKVTTNPYCVDGRSHYGRRNSFSPTPLPDLSLPPDDPKKKRKLSGSGGGCFGKKGPKDDDTIYTRSRNISACDQDKSIYARTTTSSSSKPKQQTDWL